MSGFFGAYGITYQYQNGKILDEISFEMERGEILALLGPNGSGKSTLLKTIAGILSLDRKECSGQIRLNGADFLSLVSVERARQIAYVGHELRAEFPLSAYETVALGRICHQGVASVSENESRVRWAMEQCNCWGLRDRDLHTLSGGEKQLVMLAQALAQGAKVLLIDETLSRMDLNHQIRTGKMLRNLAAEGYSFILVAHDANLACEWADSCLLLKKGKRIAHGPLKEVFTEERVRELYPGAELIVSKNPSTGAPQVFFGVKPS